MMYIPSPTLSKIRRLARRLRRHPERRMLPTGTSLQTAKLPDPAAFLDSTVPRKAPASPLREPKRWPCSERRRRP